MDESSGTKDAPARPGAARDAAAAVVEIVDATGELGAGDAAWLRSKAAAAVAAIDPLRPVRGEVRVRVVRDAEMASAHLRYLRVAGTTDVLTFDLRDEPGAALDTDLLICLDEARRQAAVHGHAPARELLLYIVHGVLHCLGHDDHDEAAAAAMHATEDRVLASIGAGATYAPGGGA